MLVQGKFWMARGLSALVGALLVVGCGDDKMETATESPTTTATTGDATGTGTTTDQPTTTVEPTTTGTTEADPTTTDDTTTGTPGVMCNPAAQDCPDGQKCTAYQSTPTPGWDANQCVPEPANGGGVGDPCQIDMGESVFSGLDNCAEGNICLNFDFDTGLGGACVEFCDTEGKCLETAGGNAVCVEGSNMGVLPICLPACDPLLQDCPDDQGCYGDPSLDGFICFSPDTGMGDGTDNAPCEFTNACAPGFSCQDAATVEGCDANAIACCTPFCSVSGGDAACAPMEDCVPFYPSNPPAGLEDVGVCAIPQ